MAAETVRRTVTVEEAGRQLGIGRNTAYEAARLGQIPVIRIGRRMVVPVAALERLLEHGNAALRKVSRAS